MSRFPRTLVAALMSPTLALWLLIGCGGTVLKDEAEGENPFRIVGYVTAGAVLDVINVSKMTHINYAFLLPMKNGELKPFGSSAQLRRVVARAAEADVKVLISVGGWGWDDEFEALASDNDRRARFVAGVVDFVLEYQLDGADIDWEYPDAGASSANFVSLMEELRKALPAGSLLTTAVVADAGNATGIDPAVFKFVDFVNIMAYDASGTDHSPLDLAEEALASWEAKGLPKEKRVLGVPFYARPGNLSYRQLLESDPKAADGDEVIYFDERRYYNGPATLRDKVELAQLEASGIMIWELSQDALGDDSLLSVIWDASRR
ncbi:MAG: glycoside hydrolase family 18 protein [Candidatus Limnocylindrus sp.]